MFKLMTNSLKLSSSHVKSHQVRAISISSILNLKKIEKIEDKATKTITIEGKYLNPEETFGSKVLNLGNNTNDDEHSSLRPCAFCELEKKDIKVQYTDVLVLRQFLTEDGQVLPRKVTGLCRKQQKKLLVLTKLAKHAGLILNLQPTLLDGTKPSSDPKNRTKHLKWNAYFDDYETMKRNSKFL
ncbi:unnamed protein product [Brachionus calyciflorus]|uniref:Mitochondrial ribosomal protein S18A n=1 Tax=Brachionus calyciflorus TaxID=104777 RepID=A0A813W6B9_9BILA|nr:unnamed protein product [Brachionus calyciflorus]